MLDDGHESFARPIRLRYPSLAYVEGNDGKMDHSLTLNNRAALFRYVKIVEKRLDPNYQVPFYNTILEADGFLLLIQDGQSVWYWLYFAPVYDYQQYIPTFVAMLATITIDGKNILDAEWKGFDLGESTASFGAHPNPAVELTAAVIAKKSLPSVVMLTMQDSRGRPLKLGSGFFVGDNLIATNFHVIKGASSGYVRLVGQVDRFAIDG